MTQQHEEDNFGEESFLDILANMVGILVILIVLAGVRVSMSRLVPVDVVEAKPEEPQVEEIVPEWPVQPLVQGESSAIAYVAPVEAPVVVPPKIYSLSTQRNEVPVTLLSTSLGNAKPDEQPVDETPGQLQQLLAKYNALSTQKKTLEAEKQRLLARGHQTFEQLKAVQQQLEQMTPQQTELQQTDEQADAEVEDLEDQLRALKAQMVLIERSDPQVKQWEHIASAIANEVKGEEYHFLVRGEQIAYVPLLEMLGMAKGQIQKRREWFQTHDSYQGIVGPLEGFTMQLRVVKVGGSTMDAIRYSGAFVRIELDEFRVLPSSSVMRETVDAALKPTSMYRDRLLNFEPGSTVTYWVYPDSFDAYQKLQAEARPLGLKIAARPLNDQEFLTGGRHGRKTMSQ